MNTQTALWHNRILDLGIDGSVDRNKRGIKTNGSLLTGKQQARNTLGNSQSPSGPISPMSTNHIKYPSATEYSPAKQLQLMLHQLSLEEQQNIKNEIREIHDKLNFYSDAESDSLAAIVSLKQNINDLECRQRDAIKESEIERSLLSGEYEQQLDHVNYDQEKLANLRRDYFNKVDRVRSLKDKFTLRFEEERIKLQRLHDRMADLRHRLNKLNASAPTAAVAREKNIEENNCELAIRRQILDDMDNTEEEIEEQKQAIEDLEFLELEEQSRVEEERESLSQAIQAEEQRILLLYEAREMRLELLHQEQSRLKANLQKCLQQWEAERQETMNDLRRQSYRHRLANDRIRKLESQLDARLRTLQGRDNNTHGSLMDSMNWLYPMPGTHQASSGRHSPLMHLLSPTTTSQSPNYVSVSHKVSGWSSDVMDTSISSLDHNLHTPKSSQFSIFHIPVSTLDGVSQGQRNQECDLMLGQTASPTTTTNTNTNTSTSSTNNVNNPSQYENNQNTSFLPDIIEEAHGVSLQQRALLNTSSLVRNASGLRRRTNSDSEISCKSMCLDDLDNNLINPNNEDLVSGYDTPAATSSTLSARSIDSMHKTERTPSPRSFNNKEIKDENVPVERRRDSGGGGNGVIGSHTKLTVTSAPQTINNLPQAMRPLTRFLPVLDDPNFHLRHHLESCGHNLCQLSNGNARLFVDKEQCTGYLHKMGGRIRTWKKRWFVFDRRRRLLGYYKVQDAKKMKGCISFADIIDVYADRLHSVKSPSPHLTFCVITPLRTYYLIANSPESLRAWIDAIFTGAEGYLFSIGDGVGGDTTDLLTTTPSHSNKRNIKSGKLRK